MLVTVPGSGIVTCVPIWRACTPLWVEPPIESWPRTAAPPASVP
ncbi:MAG: hypothetical protein ACYTG1_07285 [Planctomycetota bacterium]